jgi:orotate phosphoribosyltransferase
LWLDLESLCLNPGKVHKAAAALVEPLRELKVDAVCGPLVEGAFVGLMTALQLDVLFTYSERYARPAEGGLFPAGYRVPAPLREGLRGRRVAIVNDVINAGSAVRGTFADLEACGAEVVAIGIRGQEQYSPFVPRMLTSAHGSPSPHRRPGLSASRHRARQSA